MDSVADYHWRKPEGSESTTESLFVRLTRDILPQAGEIGADELVARLGSKKQSDCQSAERSLALLGFRAIEALADGINSPNDKVRRSCQKLFESAWQPGASKQRLDEGNRLSLEMHNSKPNLTRSVYDLMEQIAERIEFPAGKGMHKAERLRQLAVVEKLHEDTRVTLSKEHLKALHEERELLLRPDSKVHKLNADTRLHIAKALVWGGDSNGAKRFLLDAAEKCPEIVNSDEFLVKVVEGALQTDKHFLSEFVKKGGSLESLQEALARFQPIPADHPDGPRAPRRAR